MRLTIKLVGMLFVVMLIIIAVDGYLSMVREVSLFESNMRSNANMLGNVSEGMVTEVWQTKGRERALELINDINQAEHKIHLKYVDLSDQQSLNLYCENNQHKLDSLYRGHKITAKIMGADKRDSLFTLIPLKINEVDVPGMLVLSESFKDLKSYTRETLIRVFVLSAVLILVGTAMLWFLGRRYIGKPLQALMNRTHRIGTGDFSHEPVLPGHNELTHLSESINEMCDNLETARNRLEEESEKRIAALEQLRHSERLATVGRLASGVAHELGTPLNVISGRAKIMAGEVVENQELSDSCRIISEQADRMTRIIKQLLDFARRRRSQQSYSDIRPVIRQVAEMLNPMARKSSVNIICDLPNDLPQTLIDPAQIQQVLINIIVNGIQAMPQGGDFRITATAQRKIKPMDELQVEKEYMRVELIDQGEGIHPDVLNKIFDPFFTTKDIGSGTGLGLSISHGIIEEHEGWIEVQSEIGRGTTFIVNLPAGEKDEQ